MPPPIDVPFPNEDVPLLPATLLTLLGGDFQQARWITTSRVALRSRNRLYRLHLADAPSASVILKLVRQDSDRFWQHHLRREHWLLELLQRFWTAGAPCPYAMVVGPGWGLLMMEDVGEVSLADALGGRALAAGGHSAGDMQVGPSNPSAASKSNVLVDASASLQVALLTPVLVRLADLHHTLAAQQQIFRRVCQSIDLDRITAASLLARVRVAHRRLSEEGAPGGDRLPLTQGSTRAYVDAVIRPLMTGQRQVIHNSLSPLNVILSPAPRIVDWETMALARPEFDVADLLRYPAVNLPWTTLDHMVEAAFGGRIDLTRLRLAALSRAIDYAGSNAQQARTSRKAGDVAHAVTAANRRDWYLAEARRLAADIGLATTLRDMLG